MNARTHLPMLAAILSLATVAMPAAADLAIDITGPGIGSSGSASSTLNPGGTFGYQFSLSQAVTVTSLGVLDYVSTGNTGTADQVGLVDSHDVGIWNEAGTLMASGTVPATSGGAGSCSSSVATASSAELSSWCFVDITDVVLTAGNYVIGAYYLNEGDRFRFSAALGDLAVVSGMTLGGSFTRGGSALAIPDTDGGLEYGYFGPNFEVAPAAVPEPGSLALLGLGLAGLTLTRRRKSD